jgi:DNA-binding NtrC family response regulator
MNTKKLSPNRILVVDDDPAILELFRDSLMDLSFEVITATSALQALELDFSKIDCIVTDVMMPLMNGVEFISTLNARGDNKIIFFITGYKDFPREELNKLHPRAIIFKPFDIEEATILIKNHLMRLVK